MWKSNINNKQKHQVYENVKKVFIRKTQKFSFLIRSQKILSRVVNIQVTLKFEPPHMTQQPQSVRGVWPSAVTLILRTDWWSRWISSSSRSMPTGSVTYCSSCSTWTCVWRECQTIFAKFQLQKTKQNKHYRPEALTFEDMAQFLLAHLSTPVSLLVAILLFAYQLLVELTQSSTCWRGLAPSRTGQAAL